MSTLGSDTHNEDYEVRHSKREGESVACSVKGAGKEAPTEDLSNDTISKEDGESRMLNCSNDSII